MYVRLFIYKRSRTRVYVCVCVNAHVYESLVRIFYFHRTVGPPGIRVVSLLYYSVLRLS